MNVRNVATRLKLQQTIGLLFMPAAAKALVQHAQRRQAIQDLAARQFGSALKIHRQTVLNLQQLLIKLNRNMNDPLILISPEKYKTMAKLYSSVEIMERKSIKGIMRIEGNDYVITGGWGNGKGGLDEQHGERIIPEADYTGSLKLLDYGEQWVDVANGNRERSYKGMRIFYKGVPYAVISTTVRFQAKLTLGF